MLPRGLKPSFHASDIDENYVPFGHKTGRRQNKLIAVNMPHYIMRNRFQLPVTVFYSDFSFILTQKGD